MESFQISQGTKEEKYTSLLVQLPALWEGETDPIANLANTAAALMETFRFHWVGFYLVRGEFLVLGPFQGPVACTRIGFGKGVCGTAWKEAKTLVVPDVDLFPGHIACSPLSRSEIVVPVFSEGGSVLAVLDVDSSLVSDFDQTDQYFLEQICKELGNQI